MEYKIATEKDIDELMNIRLEMLRIVMVQGDGVSGSFWGII